MECPSCRAAVVDDARFCSTCGHEMVRRHDERRVVTVLFADIVGFTGLSETRDPEQVKNLVDRCFALLADDITAFGGRVDKVVGDAIIALFGAPVAHEDDAERAVRAALRMQETVGRFDRDSETSVGLQVRIGVNTGEVLVGAIAAGDDYTAMGDVVNTASRLQTSAEPGTVLVGAATQAATTEVIRYRSLGQLVARGREEPVAAYRAIEPVGQPGERRAAPMTPLFGRDPEIAVLRRVVEAAYARSRAQLVALVGESGVGKSRLAAEVARAAHDNFGARVLHGRCLPYGEANVWWPLAEALRTVVGLDAETDPAAVPALVSAAVREVHGEDVSEVEVERTAEGLRHLLGYDTTFTEADADRAADEGARSARSLINELSRHAPVLLWLSDLDLADEAVLHLVDDLLDRLGRQAVVVLVTGRAEMFDRWQPQPGRFNAVTLSLEPLDDASGDLLVRSLLPSASADLRKQLVERAGGNPLFLEEMVRMVERAEGEEVGPLPANVRSVISARLDALSDTTRHVIEDAAVLGLRGELLALARMADLQRGEPDIAESLRVLERLDLLEVTASMWSFRSNLVRDVVYSRLTKTDRAWRHAGIASWIEAHRHVGTADMIAYHYRRAAGHVRELGGVDGLPADLTEKAVSWTLVAAHATSGGSAMERSEQLFGEVLDLMGEEDPRKAGVHLDRAAAAISRLDTGLVRRDLETAAPLIKAIDDRHLQGRLLLLRSELEQWSGNQEAALAAAEEVLGIADELDDRVLTADGLRRVGIVRLFQGDHERAEASVLAADAAYGAIGDDRGVAWARQNLAWIAFLSGRMSDAESRLADAIEAFEALDDSAGTAWSRGVLAYVRIHAGRFTEAEELAQLTLDEARDRGDRWAQGMMLVALATVALWTGRIEEAIRRAHQATSMFPAVGTDPIGPVQALAVEARALVRSGRIGEGMRLLRVELATEPESPSLQVLETSLVAAAATIGDTAIARRSFAEISGFDQDQLGESDHAVAAALLQLQQGDLDAAGELFAVMPDPTSDHGSGWGWAVLALLASARGDDPAPYVNAVEAADRFTYSDRVIARCAAACGAARAGDDAGTRAALDRAYEAVPLGGDRIHPAIITLAEAVCLAALDAHDAAAAEVRAIKTAAAIGLDSTGWRIALRLACGESAR